MILGASFVLNVKVGDYLVPSDSWNQFIKSTNGENGENKIEDRGKKIFLVHILINWFILSGERMLE